MVAFGRVISAGIIGSRLRNLILIQDARISRIPSAISDDRSNSHDNAGSDGDEQSLRPTGMHFPGSGGHAEAEERDEECADTQTNPLDARSLTARRAACRTYFFNCFQVNENTFHPLRNSFWN